MQIPSFVSEMVALRVLNVRDNILVKLPDALCKLRNLESLHLEDNMIRVLPEDVSTLCSVPLLL